MLIDLSIGAHMALSEEEKAAIQEQLERLLVNPYFSHSRRFPSFLRFVVEQTLSGQTELLKERTLGIEIFGKSADYDTSSDPIVRVTAAEIRKRIAQYYQEPGHEAELRVSLPAGSYIPHFQWPNNAKEDIAGTPVAPQAGVAHTEPGVAESVQALQEEHSRSNASQRRMRIAAVVVFMALLGAGGAFFWKSMHRTAFDYFWGPVIGTSDPVLFCVADQNRYVSIVLRDAADPTRQILLKDNLTAIVIDDLSPIVRLAGVLQSNRKKYALKGEGATNLWDLRAGPTIFVGAFDNAWTLRMTKSLRYHFANDADMTKLGIVDSNSPSGNSLASSRWVVDRGQQMSTNNYRDFALVARFTDSDTGRLAVVAAGIARGGTIAASEFLTDPSNLAQLARAAQAAGKKKNMEFVLSTPIIDGEPGTPKIEASYFW